MTSSSTPLATDLAEAVEHFAQWRRTRRTSSATTPIHLRERAVALLAVHRPSTVARVLGVNTLALKRWSSSLKVDSTKVSSSSDTSSEISLSPSAIEPFGFSSIHDSFDPLPGHETVTPPPAPELPELVLRWPGGGELVARGAIPHATLDAILTAFVPPETTPPNETP